MTELKKTDIEVSAETENWAADDDKGKAEGCGGAAS